MDPGYSTAKALEIMEGYNSYTKAFDKFRFISRQEGVKLVINYNKYWFEFYGKQITPTDFYVGENFKRMLHLACS